MTDNFSNLKLGELTPSQLLYSYGVGAILDLPRISVLVNGLDDWPTDPNYVKEIYEDRLLSAVRTDIGAHIKRFLSLPTVPDTGLRENPFDRETKIGIPVSTFPQWMVCPSCRTLAPISSELFDLKPEYFHPDRTEYVHTNCFRANKPAVVPVRFLVCCENGHLDDFPWVQYVHRSDTVDVGHECSLQLSEYGPSGEARDLFVSCSCGARRQMTDAFGIANREGNMPMCRGRRPHLHDIDPEECKYKMRAILLGASNLWFPSLLSTISIPSGTDKLEMLVKDNWGSLRDVEDIIELRILEKHHHIDMLTDYSLQQIWEAILKIKAHPAPKIDMTNIFVPEWEAFNNPRKYQMYPDFMLREVDPPDEHLSKISRVVLADKLREVRTLTGFTRIDSPGEMVEGEEEEFVVAPISRRKVNWLPAVEVRGEGIFIQFNEESIQSWLSRTDVQDQSQLFFRAHIDWRKSRGAEKPEAYFPGLRYVLLHSFSHALMRQLAIDCGYSQASIRERIYSANRTDPGGPMAGVLLYTSAPDSEGTLGGLVNLGEPKELEKHIDAALESCKLCASDPTCAEHLPYYGMPTLHVAACHACMFSPETSCEKGNRYLDRTVLVNTLLNKRISFFEQQ